MRNETISFFVRPEKHAKKKKIVWTFEHNLAKLGLSLSDAFTNWVYRADNPEDVQDFKDYVKSKDPFQIIIKLVPNP